MNAEVDPLRWYMSMPLVSRLLLTCSVVTTAACALDVVSPLALYFNAKLIFQKWQLWRLLTNFFYFGSFGLDFLFHMYFMLRYSRLLEEGPVFQGRRADFAFMLLFGGTCMMLMGPYLNVHFFGAALTNMMVYVWGRHNEYVRMSFMGLFPFTAPYLPWVLCAFAMLAGGNPTVDLIGIAVGHLYFYLKVVLPQIAEFRGWKHRDFLPTPWLLRILCDQRPAGAGQPLPAQLAPGAQAAAEAAAAAARAGAAAAAAGMDADDDAAELVAAVEAAAAADAEEEVEELRAPEDYSSEEVDEDLVRQFERAPVLNRGAPAEARHRQGQNAEEEEDDSPEVAL